MLHCHRNNKTAFFVVRIKVTKLQRNVKLTAFVFCLFQMCDCSRRQFSDCLGHSVWIQISDVERPFSTNHRHGSAAAMFLRSAKTSHGLIWQTNKGMLTQWNAEDYFFLHCPSTFPPSCLFVWIHTSSTTMTISIVTLPLVK